MGMVVYEIISGNVPFGERLLFSVPGKVLSGERPTRPLGEGGRLFTDGIWGVIELCWGHEPGERASAEGVLRCLEGGPPPSRASLHGVDHEGGADPDSDDQLDAMSDDSL